MVSQKGLMGSFNVMKKIIDNFEKSVYPKTKITCEPNLGKRNLYPTLSQKETYEGVKLRMNLLTYSDGQTSIFEISKLLNQPTHKIIKEYKLLKLKGILH